MSERLRLIIQPPVSLSRYLSPKLRQLRRTERTARQINDFGVELAEDEELALSCSTADASAMHMADGGNWGPDMLINYGENER